MGKTAEPQDYIAVSVCVARELFILERLDKRDGAILVGSILAVFVGEVNKNAPLFRDFLIPAVLHHLACNRKGERVAFKAERITAKQIARKLVKHEDRGKPSFRPRWESQRRGSHQAGVQGLKAFGDLRIERIAFGKPVTRREFLEPKFKPKFKDAIAPLGARAGQGFSNGWLAIMLAGDDGGRTKI